MKYVLLLAIGVAIGYGYGFSDAQVNRKNIVSRIVDRVGGSNREEFTNDIDDRMDKASNADRPGR